MPKKGFTLAEVLITLGIIGVVAALTVPTLIKNYQKKVYVTALQKGYSQIQNGFKLMMANEGVEKMSHTQMYKAFSAYKPSRHGALEIYLGKYMKISKACGGTPDCFPNWKYPIGEFDIGDKQIDGFENGKLNVNHNLCSDVDEYPCIQLADGSIIHFFKYIFYPSYKSDEDCKRYKAVGSNFCSTSFYLVLDTNGEKAPNLLGRDIWKFWVDDYGNVYPSGSLATSANPYTSMDNWDEYWKNSLCAPEGGVAQEAEGDIDGDGEIDRIKYNDYSANWNCAARVIETGRMDY